MGENIFALLYYSPVGTVTSKATNYILGPKLCNK